MPRKAAAFTLIEVVIAISILAVILGTAYSAITQIIGTKRILDDKRDNALAAHAIIRRLGKELQLTTDDNNLICSPEAGNNNTTVKFLGQGRAGSGGDGLTFVAMEGGQYMPDGGTHTGLVQITYRLATDPEIGRQGVYSLIREEVPYAEPPNTNDPKAWQNAIKKSCDKKIVFPVAENVISFSLKYFDIDEGQWQNEWDLNERGIPAMVYYSISLVSPLGQIDTYATAVPISAGR